LTDTDLIQLANRWPLAW